MESLITPQAFFPDYSGFLGDKRLERRASSLFSILSSTPSSSIQYISSSRAEQKAYYRLLNNDKVSEDHLINEATSRLKKFVQGRDLLCIQDTSEINLSSHKGRLKPDSGLGRSDNSETAHCFKLHPSLVLDAASFSPLGFSHIKLFHRPQEMPNRMQRVYKSQPIKEKESYKWIEACEESKVILDKAQRVTFVEDREGDIFEQFALIANDKYHFVVRSRTTRRLAQNKDLYTEVDNQPILGTYTIELPTDRRKDQYKRTATIELRVCKCQIMCPSNLKNRGYPKTLELSCISAKEIEPTKKPIHWRLLTTHQIDDFQQALQVVDYYSARWYIEQLFRILKKQGFGIESTQLESGWAIRKLVIMQMVALLKILQMNIAYATDEGQPIEEVFDPDQIEVLKLINTKLEGKTQKLKNNYIVGNTKWAAWVIGRMGGWKGYDSQGPPGVITLIRGMERLGYIMEGMKLAKDVGTQ